MTLTGHSTVDGYPYGHAHKDCGYEFYKRNDFDNGYGHGFVFLDNSYDSNIP